MLLGCQMFRETLLWNDLTKTLPEPIKGFWWTINEKRAGADAINISGLLNPKKFGNFKNLML